MAQLADAVTSYLFGGIPSNAAWDLIKASWQQATRKSLGELLLDAFQVAVEDARPQLAKYAVDGEVGIDRAALATCLQTDLHIAIDAPRLGQLSEDAFVADLAEQLAGRSVLWIGGHRLSAEDYAQLLRNLVRQAVGLFKDSIVEHEPASRHTLLNEALANQDLVQAVQAYLVDRFGIALGRLEAIETKIDAQTELMRRLAGALQEDRSQPAAPSSPSRRRDSQRKLIRLFVASPGDVREERDRIHLVVQELNQSHGLADQYGLKLEILDWRDVVSGMGRAEQVILDQLPIDSWDILVGVLWLRFGTPTGGRDAQSGRYYDSGDRGGAQAGLSCLAEEQAASRADVPGRTRACFARRLRS
ncbi:MAG: hypothetical protein HY690_02315 [Chloroflexi bacterium]|nr:hypothetical protein [Chloroflexota bacterium]